MKTTQHAYLSRLDHLRFFAAALVVLFHYFHTKVGDLRSGNPLVSLIDEGHTGIALFMVISGFIFTVIAGDRPIHYGGFIRNRILRIYPLFVFAVFLQLFISTYNDHRNYGFLQLLGWLMPFRSETVPLSPYFAQLWSIWVEFQFYLIFPFFLAFSRRQGARYLWAWLGLLILVRALVFAASGSVRFLAYETIFGRLDQFILGMLLGRYWLARQQTDKEDADMKPRLSPIWLIMAGATVTVGVHLFSRKVGFSETTSSFWIVWPGLEAGLWALFTLVYLNTRWIGPDAVRKGIDTSLAALGTVSFSTYVMHNLVIAAINARLPGLGVGSGAVADAIATGAMLVLPAVLMVAAATYHLIERPFLTLRRPYLADEARNLS